MLDPAILKDNLEDLESNISRRNLEIDVNHLIFLNDLRSGKLGGITLDEVWHV